MIILGKTIDLIFIFELLLLGASAGVLAGFFGIGGGTVIIPVLLFMGYDIKTAIGISVMQMSFASVYGSFLNFKRGSLHLKTILPVAIGGAFGALLSGSVISALSAQTLEYSFLFFVMFALIRMLSSSTKESQHSKVHPGILFFIGLFLGTISISIGVGGSLLLVPILVGFFNFDIKKAIAAGLFFVAFASMSGLVSLSYAGHIQYVDALIVASASMVGVFFGIKISHKTPAVLQKKLLIGFYLLVVSYFIFRTFS